MSKVCMSDLPTISENELLEVETKSETNQVRMTVEEANDEVNKRRQVWLDSIKVHNDKDGEIIHCELLLERLKTKTSVGIESVEGEINKLKDERYKLLINTYENFKNFAEFVIQIKDSQINRIEEIHHGINQEPEPTAQANIDEPDKENMD